MNLPVHTLLRHADPDALLVRRTLVGAGAARLARADERVAPERLVSPAARSLWERWRARLVEVEGKAMQDTVGAVACVDGDMAAGVSSGGILLKLPGRLGEAAVYGAGCWAAGDVACSVSGTGEDIVRSALARTIAEAIIARGADETHDALHDVLTKSFCEPCFARGEPEPSAGALVLVREGSTVRLWCGFTTPSMAIAYASTAHPKPKAMILRRPASVPAPAASDAPRARVYITALSLNAE